MGTEPQLGTFQRRFGPVWRDDHEQHGHRDESRGDDNVGDHLRRLGDRSVAGTRSSELVKGRWWQTAFVIDSFNVIMIVTGLAVSLLTWCCGLAQRDGALDALASILAQDAAQAQKRLKQVEYFKHKKGGK